MGWQQASSKLVTHSEGHRIELKAGTWAEPFDIHPVIKKGTSSIEAAKLIREGITFAAKSASAKRRPLIGA